MARKYTERYVRFYTVGSAAAKLDTVERKAALPEYKTPEKRKPIPVDPIALVGSAVAVLLAVLMLVGFAQVAHTSAQVKKLQTQVMTLELEQEQLRQKYENGYDLEKAGEMARMLQKQQNKEDEAFTDWLNRFCQRKWNSEFSKEMSRSCTAMVKDWLK